MNEIRPFQITIPDADLEDLHRRLAATRWSDQVSGTSWERGLPPDALKELADDFRVRFDWRTQEAKLNRFPQFVTDIDGQRIHFLHLRSDRPDAMPLVLTHGFPS